MSCRENSMNSACPPTERLYYSDAYLRSFDARVAAVRPDGWIALNRSAFYPTSGGQPFDTGTLTGRNGKVRVTDVEADTGIVWHKTEGAFEAGEQVRGEIDWERRWDHMQQHAGDHMLAGAAWQLFGGVTIGLHLGRDVSSIDLDFPDGRVRLKAEEIERLETLVNQRVQSDDPIRCWFPDEKELALLPMRKQPTVTRHVRVVAMGDYEMVPCGGTHPLSTGQIGPVKVMSVLPARGKARLSFLAGMRAVRYFQTAADAAERMAETLSSTVSEAPGALLREKAAWTAERKELAQRLSEAALTVLKASCSGHVYFGHLPFADHDALLKAAGALTREPKAAALLSCPKGDGRLLIFARGSENGLDMAALLRQSGAKGGGRPDMALGAAPDEQALENALKTVLPDQK